MVLNLDLAPLSSDLWFYFCFYSWHVKNKIKQSSPTWSFLAGMATRLTSWCSTPGAATWRRVLAGELWKAKNHLMMTSLPSWCHCTWSPALRKSHSVVGMVSPWGLEETSPDRDTFDCGMFVNSQVLILLIFLRTCSGPHFVSDCYDSLTGANMKSCPHAWSEGYLCLYHWGGSFFWGGDFGGVCIPCSHSYVGGITGDSGLSCVPCYTRHVCQVLLTSFVDFTKGASGLILYRITVAAIVNIPLQC